MSTKKKFEEKIAELEILIKRHEAEIEVWRTAIKMLPKDEVSSKRQSEAQLRPGSDMEKVKIFLESAGRPQRIEAIVEGLGKENQRDVRISLGSQIQAYVRKGHFFTKPAPNTFWLTNPPEDAHEVI